MASLAALEAARESLGLSIAELWITSFAVGGNHDGARLRGYPRRRRRARSERGCAQRGVPDPEGRSPAGLTGRPNRFRPDGSGHNRERTVKQCMITTELDPTSPKALMRCFADRLNTADLDGLVALYEPSAVFEPQPGHVVHGHTAIRQALADLLAIRPKLIADTVQVLAAGGSRSSSTNGS